MNAETIRKELSAVFTDMTDFAFRDLSFGKETVTIAYLVGFCSRVFVNKYIIEPISRAYAAGEANFPLESLITNIKVEQITDVEAAVRAILSGKHFGDGIAIRQCAAQHNIVMLTSLDTVRMVLDVLEEVTLGISTINQE